MISNIHVTGFQIRNYFIFIFSPFINLDADILLGIAVKEFLKLISELINSVNYLLSFYINYNISFATIYSIHFMI